MSTATDLKLWPIFSLLEPEFVLQIHMVVVYGAVIQVFLLSLICGSFS